MDIEDMKGIVMSRRSALKRTGGIALLLSQAALLERVALTPARPAFAASFSDIQFDVGQFMPPNTYAGVNTYNDGAGAVTASFGPIYSLFTLVTLTRTPTRADKTTLASALVCLQRTSRAADGTPLHIRMDGPGFDGMDVPAFQTHPDMPSISVPVPAGTNQFKLQFFILQPTSEFFRQLRVSAASQDLFAQFGQPADPTGESGGVQFSDNGLERFITATRRQNFLVPPRRNRALPLVELA